MKDISLSKILQDTSAIIGSLLPIAQLFFSKWIYAFDHIFIAKEQFLGISIITLIVSYVFIIAYLSSPYKELILPGQANKTKKLQKYWNDRNILQTKLNTFVGLMGITPNMVNKVLKDLQELKQPDSPKKIDSQNQISIVVGIVVLSTLIFVVLAFGPKAGWIVACLQSIAYVLLVAFSALMLTIYKRNSDNNSQWRENNRTRADRAIKLAIDANGFGNLPQVTFVSQIETGNIGAELIVRADYKNARYEIVTDREAEFLKSITKQTNQQIS